MTAWLSCSTQLWGARSVRSLSEASGNQEALSPNRVKVVLQRAKQELEQEAAVSSQRARSRGEGEKLTPEQVRRYRLRGQLYRTAPGIVVLYG